MAKPWLIITGATGFLGRQLVHQLRKEYRIYALGRRRPAEVGIAEGPDVRCFQVDIADLDQLREVFWTISGRGGAELLVHMAAYYDFGGQDDPEYHRTNVVGTHNLFELSVPLGLRQLVFVSSVAACPFPEPGAAVTELTPPAAPVPYARSKRLGEEMVREFADRIPGCIVRPSAIFSDWCEYEPLYHFFDNWCSRGWNARVLGGRGESAVPYLHVDDLLSFFVAVVERVHLLEPSEVLLASPDGSTTHRDLFAAATRACFGSERRPLLVPRHLAGIGVRALEWWGDRRGDPPFERSWMVPYIDRRLTVDASHSRRRLDWAPNPRLDIVARLPTVIGHLRSDADEWRLRRLRKAVRRTALPGHGTPPLPTP